MTAFIILAAFCLTSAQEVEDLRVVNAFEGPLTAGQLEVHNAGNSTIDLADIQIQDPAGNPCAIWALPERTHCQPGETVYISYTKTDAATRAGTLRVGTKSLLFHPTPATLTADYTCYDDDNQHLYVYLRNAEAEPFVAHSLTIGNAEIVLPSPTEILPGQKAMVHGKCEHIQTGNGRAATLTIADPAGRSVRSFCRVFLKDNTVFSTASGEPHTDCVSHRYPNYQLAAHDLETRVRSMPDQMATLNLCIRDLLCDALPIFSQFCPCVYIDAQRTAQEEEYLSEDYVEQTLLQLEQMRESVAPGIMAMWIFGSDKHIKTLAPFSLSRIRNTVYAALAAGLKGLDFRRAEAGPAQEANTRLMQVLKEIQPIQPMIAISDPLPLAECSDSRFTTRSLLCGIDGVLLFILPRRILLADGPSSLTVSVRSPGYPLAAEAIELDTAECVQGTSSAAEPGRISFDVPTTDVAVIYLLPPRRN